uniref:Putative secreted protein n=1 Tax=Panstrongylus lignarius TaxID=156445 RepID=A0A224XSG3_9HEMI
MILDLHKLIVKFHKVVYLASLFIMVCRTRGSVAKSTISSAYIRQFMFIPLIFIPPPKLSLKSFRNKEKIKGESKQPCLSPVLV